MTPAALDIPGQQGGSNLRRYVLPRASRMLKPGVTPWVLALTTVHGALRSGPSPSIGPRAASAGVTGRSPMRFVNQDEFGTSSSELRSDAGRTWSPPNSTPTFRTNRLGLKNRPIGKMKLSSIPARRRFGSRSAGRGASLRSSISHTIGASRSGGTPAPAARASAHARSAARSALPRGDRIAAIEESPLHELEDLIGAEQQRRLFFAAGPLEARDQSVPGLDAQSEAVGELHIVETDLLGVVEDLAVVGERVEIEPGAAGKLLHRDGEPVLGVERHEPAIPETEAPISAEYIRGVVDQEPLERDHIPARRIEPGAVAAEREHAIGMPERHELLQLGAIAPETHVALIRALESLDAALRIGPDSEIPGVPAHAVSRAEFEVLALPEREARPQREAGVTVRGARSAEPEEVSFPEKGVVLD